MPAWLSLLLTLSSADIVVAYTGDTGPDPVLAELGRDADAFIVDATDRYQRRAGDPLHAGAPMNLTARDGGRGRGRSPSSQTRAHAFLAR